MTTPYEDLVKSNHDYHEAIDEILCDDITITDMELRVEVKTSFAVQVAQVFHHMEMANNIIKPHYEESG